MLVGDAYHMLSWFCKLGLKKKKITVHFILYVRGQNPKLNSYICAFEEGCEDSGIQVHGLPETKCGDRR